MGRRVTITEYLDLDVDEGMWYCSACNRALIDAEENYKKGCLVHKRDPREVHNPVYEAEFNFAPDPNWVSILEFYCPGCGVQMEVEGTPEATPIVHTYELNF